MRRPMSKRSFKRKFNKARRRTRSVNAAGSISRGGFRF